LAITGLTWFAGNFSADLVYLHRGPLIHLLLTYPKGRATSRTERGAIGAGYAVAVVASAWASEAVTLALCALLLAAPLRERGAMGGARRGRAVAHDATAAVAAVLAAGAIARLVFPEGDADELALLAYQAVLCAVAAALAGGLAARTWERSALTDLVVELGETRSSTLRDALARALGDPTLEVGYWAPEAQAYVDAEGRAIALPVADAQRSVTLVERDGRAVAALVHDPAVLDDPRLVEAVASSARMAASNARLQAMVRTQLAELQASRRRVLAAGDAERRRLEQLLHDGAERRLDELSISVQRAHGQAAGQALARIERVEDLLSRTREDLSALGRGLHPRALTEGGLAGAIESLADASPVPVEVAITGERLAPEIEAVAYFVCAEALANAAKHAHASHVAVVVRRHGERLVLEVRDDGAGGAGAGAGAGLRGLADRVAAVGGQLRLESPRGGGTRLAAELPLGGETR
jgi:signal transduction histidine kinase